MNRLNRTLLVLAATMFLAGCTERHDHDEHDIHVDEHGHEHEADDHGHDSHGSDDDGHNDAGDEEGRTHIAADIAAAAGIETAVAGAGVIVETIRAYGTLVSPPGATSVITARFAGIIQSVNVSVGDTVSKGDVLAYVEADDSLTRYAIRSPISGVVARRVANTGESTGDRLLFSIVDPTSLWAELAVFSGDLPRIRAGASATVTTSFGGVRVAGNVAQVSPVAEVNQSVVVRVPVGNEDGALMPGMKVSGDITVDRHAVPVAVKRIGLQTFEGQPVIYVQHGNEYEAREIEPGRQDDQWIEVLRGIEAGTRYVTSNSYVVKADIEKSGAEHQH